MKAWIERYLSYGFPIIPLRYGTKCPVMRGWDKDYYVLEQFRRRNVGVRAGERVNVNGKEGHLLILDYDSGDIGPLKELCAELPLPRTTCVRTGGQHQGYHLFYLTAFETRKKGMLSYRGTSVDLLGKGSFAVIPPSVVDSEYRYLLGLEELAFLPRETYDLLVSTLQRWKQLALTIKRIEEGKLDPTKAREQLDGQGVSEEMRGFFEEALESVPMPLTSG